MKRWRYCAITMNGAGGIRLSDGWLCRIARRNLDRLLMWYADTLSRYQLRRKMFRTRSHVGAKSVMTPCSPPRRRWSEMSETKQAMADAFQVYLDGSGIDGTHAFLSGLDYRLAQCWTAAWEAAHENAARICEERMDRNPKGDPYDCAFNAHAFGLAEAIREAAKR